MSEAKNVVMKKLNWPAASPTTRGPHEPRDLAHGGVLEVERGRVVHALVDEPGHLDGEMERGPGDDADGEAANAERPGEERRRRR